MVSLEPQERPIGIGDEEGSLCLMSSRSFSFLFCPANFELCYITQAGLGFRSLLAYLPNAGVTRVTQLTDQFPSTIILCFSKLELALQTHIFLFF